MVRFFLCVSLWGSFASAQDLAAQRYSLEDLERMAQNKEWGRVILNIKDVPKADQNAQWKSLLEKAAVGYVSDLKKGGFTEAEKIVQDLAAEFPSLRESYSFEKLQTEIYIEAYEKCFSKISDIPDCVTTAIGVLKDKGTSFELRQKLAPLVLLKSKKSLDALCEIFLGLKELSGFYQKNCPRKQSNQKSQTKE